MANYFLKLLLLSGRYLTQNAERSLLQISLKSAEAQSHWSRYYQNAISMVGSEENVLEIMNSRLRELDVFAPEERRGLDPDLPFTEKPLQATKQCSTSSLALSHSGAELETSEKAVQTSEVLDDYDQIGDAQKLNVVWSHIVNTELNSLAPKKANYKFLVKGHHQTGQLCDKFLPVPIGTVNTRSLLGNSNRYLKEGIYNQTHQESAASNFHIPQQSAETKLQLLMLPLLLELYFKIQQLNASITHFRKMITGDHNYKEASDNTSNTKLVERRTKLYRMKVYSEKFPFNINSTFHQIAMANIRDVNKIKLKSDVTILSTVEESEEKNYRKIFRAIEDTQSPPAGRLQQIKLFSDKFPFYINSTLYHAANFNSNDYAKAVFRKLYANNLGMLLFEVKDDIKERTDILEINRKVFEDMEQNMRTVKLIEQVENDGVTQEESGGDLDGDSSDNRRTHFVSSPEVTSAAVNRFEISRNRNGFAPSLINALQELIGNIAIYQPILFTITLPLTNSNYNVFKRKDLYFQNIFSRYKQNSFERDDIVMIRINNLHALSKNVQTQNDIPLLHSGDHQNDSITEMLIKPMWTLPDIQTIYINNKIKAKHLENNNIVSALMLKLEEFNSCLKMIECEQKRLFVQLLQQLAQTNEIMKKNVINVLETIPKTVPTSSNRPKTLMIQEISKPLQEKSDEEIFKVRSIYNELPFYFGRQRIISMLSILPHTTLWNNQPKLPVDVNAIGLSKQMKLRFPLSKKDHRGQIYKWGQN